MTPTMPSVFRSGLRTGAALLLVAGGYYAGAKLGFALTLQPRPVSSTLWLPNAILMAAFLMTPVRWWWLVLASAFPAHIAVQQGAGVPWPLILSWFVSNSAEGLLGAAFVLRFVERPVRLDRLQTVVVFVVFGVLLPPFLSSFLDAAFVQLNDWGQGGYWTVWRARFFSNTVATLVAVPVVLSWAARIQEPFAQVRPTRYVETVLLLAALVAVSFVVFGRLQAGPGTLSLLLYAPLPLLLWAAVRFGPLGASTSTLAFVLFAFWSSVHGRGLFVAPAPEANALSLQLMFFVMSLTLITLAALIEERQQALKGARQSREHLQLALDAARMSTWDLPIPPETGKPSPTSTFETALAFLETKDRVGVLSPVHADDLADLKHAIQTAVAEGDSYEREFRIARPDGSFSWVLGKGKVLFDDEGRPVRVLGINVDLSERKAAEALTEAENHILEMIAGGAPLSDVLNKLVVLVEREASGLLCSILLLDPDGVHMRHGAGPSLPEVYTKAIDGLAIGPRVGSCGTAMYLASPVIVKDIQEDPLWDDHRDLALAHGLRACWSTPIISHRGKVMGSLAMYYRNPREPSHAELKLIDFATQLATIALEREVAERESQEQRRELTHLGRVATLGGLSGALAHELSQPLAAILADAQTAQRLLDRSPPRVPEVREILADIVSAHERAGILIDHLRGMLSKRRTERTPLELNNVVDEVLQLLRRDLADRQVIVGLQTTALLPPVMGDRVQLEQVLLNLIVNACEAMAGNRSGDRKLTITTGTSPNGSVQVSVADNGIGIPKHLVSRIGEPFVTSKPHGLGLGLSISRTILQAHGGHLFVENNAERGCAFHLVLPPRVEGHPLVEPAAGGVRAAATATEATKALDVSAERAARPH